MKITLGTGLAALALSLSGDAPQYTCEAGDTQSCAWTLETVREVQTSTLSLMGNDQDIGSGSTTTTSLSLEISEEIKKATETGAPAQIVRTYETITKDQNREGLESSEGMIVVDNSGSSELEGQTVIFSFDEEAEDWSAAYDEDSGGEADWLEELTPRIDLASLLPADGEAPEVGSSWELAPEVMGDLILPGGQVVVAEPTDPGDMPEGGIAISIPSGSDVTLYDELEGDLIATFQEIVEEDDRRLARIVIEVDLSAELDLIDQLEEEALERGAEESYSEALFSRSFEGEVTLLWDLTTGRAFSLSGELSGTEELTADWSIQAGEMDLGVAAYTESELTHTIEATFGD